MASTHRWRPAPVRRVRELSSRATGGRVPRALAQDEAPQSYCQYVEDDEAEQSPAARGIAARSRQTHALFWPGLEPLLLIVAALAILGCDDEVSWPGWSDDLTACDPREAPCAARLARGLAAIHGVEWPDGIAVEVVEPGPSSPPSPLIAWRNTLAEAPTPFDVLDSSWPPLPRHTGSVRLFGAARLQFRQNPRVDGDDAALRHRIGFIRSLLPHIRSRSWPGHPVDIFSPWPSRGLARSALRTAQANIIENAIQRAARGQAPWAFPAADLTAAERLRDESGTPEALALAALYAGHDPDDPAALLFDLPAELGATCLPAIAFGDVGRCVEVDPVDLPDEIDGFVARRADAADAILLDEALREADHPAAPLTSTLRAHFGRSWNRDDGAGARQDVFVFDDAAAAAAFADTLASALDADDGWIPRADDRWEAVAEAEDDPWLAPHVGGEAVLRRFETQVVRVSVTAGVDPEPFIESGTDIAVTAMTDPTPLPDLPCDTDLAPEAPCDVRQACCRSRLVSQAEAILGVPMPTIALRVLDPDTAVAAYVGPRWAVDRYADRVAAEVRFATGIDHTLRISNDASAEERARRVLAWYENTRRRVVLVVPTGADAERNFARENSTLIHELAHAWQDATLGLTALRLEARSLPGDREAALVSAIEGHAELVATIFEVSAEPTFDADDWLTYADDLVERIAPAIEAADEPARTASAWLPYIGGAALAIRAFVMSMDPAAVGETMADGPDSTGVVLADIYEETAATPDDQPLPTGDADDPAFAGHSLLHRGFIGIWPLALRLTAEVGAEDALAAVRGVTAAREVVTRDPDGARVTWIEVRAAFDVERVVEALDALGAALAERQMQTYIVESDGGIIRLLVGPEAALAPLADHID